MAKQKVSSIQKKVQPWKLYTMVSGLLAVDIALLVSWQVFDPLQRKMETFPLESSWFGDDDAMIRPELEHCESIHNNIWLGKLINVKLIFDYRSKITDLRPCFRFGLQLQRNNSGIRTVFGVRNEEHQS